MAAQSGAENADPLAQFLTDPAAVFQWTQGPDKTQRLAEMMQQSPLFQQLRNFGSEVLERRQVAQLPAGALVELRGLSAAAYNGLVGELADASPAERDQHPGRRIVELGEGVEDSTRLAVHPKNLIFPRHKPGDAVTLAAEFEPGSEHEGLEGRAGVISSLTEEERGLGFSEQTGGLVVDVLSLLPGGPVLDRVWLWPEHLARRNFQVGDGVRMRDLEADSSLNGLPATVEAPGTRPWSYVVVLDDGRRLEVKWRNLLLSSCSVATAAGLG
ncbi:unnamed protein product [Effrenium voratum]|nr:unnamed protein product [Effrenium voratum]